MEKEAEAVMAEEVRPMGHVAGQARQGGSLVEAAETALQRFVLLQWLWFDLRCRSYGDEVRPVCGFWDVGESRSVLRHAVY